jgi:succinate dehydrogenase / fumarate reductase flavoprotein subunit
MARNERGLEECLRQVPEIREEFWRNVSVPGTAEDLNQALEYAGRVADYLEFAELLCLDALERRESCGGHFREEFQEKDAQGHDTGECRRDDRHFQHVAAWEYRGEGQRPRRHVEPLVFEEVKPSVRSYA